MIHLYLDIGQSVVERQKKDGWGVSIIEQMSRDIQKDFPGIEGFSASNISRMRAFYLAWKDTNSISAQAVPKKSDFLSRIPWGHHVVLLFKIKDLSERIWYLQKANSKRGTQFRIWATNVLSTSRMISAFDSPKHERGIS